MIPATRQRLDTILGDYTARDRHAANIRRQLQEEREARARKAKLRAVQAATLSGQIRR
jgi:hypothetical protein